MSGPRWKEAGSALANVAEKAAIYDPNGIDIHFLNSQEAARDLTVSCHIFTTSFY